METFVVRLLLLRVIRLDPDIRTSVGTAYNGSVMGITAGDRMTADLQCVAGQHADLPREVRRDNNARTLPNRTLCDRVNGDAASNITARVISSCMG